MTELRHSLFSPEDQKTTWVMYWKFEQAGGTCGT
jgi:hypothetical protein